MDKDVKMMIENPEAFFKMKYPNRVLISFENIKGKDGGSSGVRFKWKSK